jgi:hypothetical protein
LKKISLIVVLIVGFLGLGTAVYASPLNEKATNFLDYCLSMMKNEEDPCEKKDMEEMLKENTAAEETTNTSAHCMTEAAPKE